jgi:hypothetical protein
MTGLVAGADNAEDITPGRVRDVRQRQDYVLDIVIPVYNEEVDLPYCVRRLHAFLANEVPYRSRITIADNASTDETLVVANQLADELADVAMIHLEAKGRGGALQAAWSTSDATVVAYMDVDLSTHLSALMPLVAPLISGHSDVAIGSRLAASSRVVRGPKREFVSRSYNLLLRGVLGARFSDAQCGFKAVRTDVGVGLDIGRGEQAGLQLIAENAEGLHHLGAEVQRVLNVWPDCRTRPRRRSIDFSRRNSRGLAYVDGSVRDRHVSPSSLSKSSCWLDIPTKPWSSASASMRSIWACSALVGRSSLRVARSKPIVAARMSE